MAKDVLQTSYLKALEKRGLFQGKSSFKTWLFTIIKNTAYDQHISLKKTLVTDELPDYAINQTELADRENQQQLILTLLGRLSDMQREVLQLSFYHGNTLEECAEIMDKSIGTIRTHYARGKKRLKEMIETHDLKELL